MKKKDIKPGDAYYIKMADHDSLGPIKRCEVIVNGFIGSAEVDVEIISGEHKGLFTEVPISAFIKYSSPGVIFSD